MGSILESLFYGNIRPDESIHPKDSEYHELNLKISLLINASHKKLSPEDYGELEKPHLKLNPFGFKYYLKLVY
ncbi:hypothetical protein D3C76_1600300 [compost metagenome]